MPRAFAKREKNAGTQPQAASKLEAYFKQYPIKTYDAGQIFLLPNESVERIYLIVSGAVRVFELVHQAIIHGIHYENDTYLIPISEGEIGARSGLSRETVSRQMREFKAKDLICVNQSGIWLRSIRKLETILGTFL
jgi:CRP-like cAMP-binding protein